MLNLLNLIDDISKNLGLLFLLMPALLTRSAIQLDYRVLHRLDPFSLIFQFPFSLVYPLRQLLFEFFAFLVLILEAQHYLFYAVVGLGQQISELRQFHLSALLIFLQGGDGTQTLIKIRKLHSKVVIYTLFNLYQLFIDKVKRSIHFSHLVSRFLINVTHKQPGIIELFLASLTHLFQLDVNTVVLRPEVLRDAAGNALDRDIEARDLFRLGLQLRDDVLDVVVKFVGVYGHFEDVA